MADHSAAPRRGGARSGAASRYANLGPHASDRPVRLSARLPVAVRAPGDGRLGPHHRRGRRSRPPVHPGRDLRQGARLRGARLRADPSAPRPCAGSGPRARGASSRSAGTRRSTRSRIAGAGSSPSGAPEALLPFSYGGTLGIVQVSAGHPLFHALGASRLDRTICISTAYAGWRATLGAVTGSDAGADGRTSDLDRAVGHQRLPHPHQRDDAGQAGAAARRLRGLHRSLPHRHRAAGRLAPDAAAGNGRRARPGDHARARSARAGWTRTTSSAPPSASPRCAHHVEQYDPERVAAHHRGGRGRRRRPSRAATGRPAPRSSGSASGSPATTTAA